MSLSNRKITSSDITSYGVIAAPDTMTGTAADNKRVFDRLIRDIVKADLNGLIDDLMSDTAASELGFDTPTGMEATNIQDAIEEIKDDAESGSEKATAEALKSEGYAVGKQDGTDVGSTSPYYHNNSKYYSEQASGYADSASGSASTATTKAQAASDSASNASNYKDLALSYKNTTEGYMTTTETYKNAAATSASNASTSESNASASETSASGSALKSEGYAVGKQNGTDVGESSPYYHNNAAYYSGQAGTSATNAATSESNAESYKDTAVSSAGTATTKASEAATSATTSATKALASEGYALGKQNGTDVESGSPYYHNNSKYYAEHCVGEKMTFGTDDIVQFESGNETGGFVSYAEGQTLTDSEKETARGNIGAYSKPSTGIPETDLASAVQSSLDSADSHRANTSNPHSVTIAQVAGSGYVNNITMAVTFTDGTTASYYLVGKVQ